MTSIQRISFDFPNTQRISVFHLAPENNEAQMPLSLLPLLVNLGYVNREVQARVDTVTVVVWQRWPCACMSVLVCPQAVLASRSRCHCLLFLSSPTSTLLPLPPPGFLTMWVSMCNHVSGLWPFTLCVCDLWRVIPHDQYRFRNV